MKKNMIRIIIANVFYMVVVAATNFILPKFTSVETYAATKEYTLYLTTYSSIIILGYMQGMYVRYGGKTINEIPVKERNNIVIAVIISLITLAICAVSYVVIDKILPWMIGKPITRDNKAQK